MNDPRPFCIRCGERWLPDEGVDAQSVPCQFCARPMTKPDSTDAGGVTHEEARRHVTHFAAESVKASLLTYIDQQEAALATLTRERDELRAKLNATSKAIGVAHTLGMLQGPAKAAEPATPPAPLPVEPVWTAADFAAIASDDDDPAPLPRGQGPVTVAMLHQLFYDAPSDTVENFVCYIVNTLADRLEQGGEGREG